MNASIEKYLKAYNWIQLIGWLAGIISLPINFLVSFYVICFVQILSLLEIFHAYKKWNNSSPWFCFIQIGARLFILFFTWIVFFMTLFRTIPYFYPVVYIMLATWCIAEIIRYTYYVMQLTKQENKTITWLRYSAFIICYPIGIACEFFIMYTVFAQDDQLGIRILMIVVTIAYVFLFPKLYNHMLKQRTQKLNTLNS